MVRFIYRDIFKIDINADTYSEAIRILKDREPIFNIHPLSFDDWGYI